MRHGPSIAILCPGPSLAGFLARPPLHDVCIGVNRSVEAWPCDWWAFADHETFGLFEPLGHPSIATTDQAAILGARKFPDRWQHYAMHVGMVLAEHLGAGEIVAYGADLQGAADWDGTLRNNRERYRWDNERHKLDHLVAWLAAEGVEFRRVLATKTE